MTTATTNTVVDHTTDASFRTWVAEVITMLFTTLGVTQTADTGQINTSTVLRPTTITSAGYVIGRFNDTAQGASPIFFKLEFGTATTVATPRMWITIGTGSNGAGTLTGVVGTRVVCDNATGPASTSTPYITAGCYSAAAGFLGLAWKINGAGTATSTMAGFFIFRSADNTGAPTTDAVMLLTNAQGLTGSTNGGWMQAISYLNSTAYNTSASYSGTYWGAWPFSSTTTIFGGNSQTGLVFQFTPVIGITPWLSLALISEWGMNTTNLVTQVGATPHTYRQVGGGAGWNQFLSNAFQSSIVGLVMLWE